METKISRNYFSLTCFELSLWRVIRVTLRSTSEDKKRQLRED